MGVQPFRNNRRIKRYGHGLGEYADRLKCRRCKRTNLGILSVFKSRIVLRKQESFVGAQAA